MLITVTTVMGFFVIVGDIVHNQSVVSLAYKNGKVYGGTSVWGGLGAEPVETEGRHLVWNVSSGVKEMDGFGNFYYRDNTVNLWKYSDPSLLLHLDKVEIALENTTLYKNENAELEIYMRMTVNGVAQESNRLLVEVDELATDASLKSILVSKGGGGWIRYLAATGIIDLICNDLVF